MFLVIDFIAGRNLDEWRKTAKPNLYEIVGAVQDIAAAVAAAHEENVIHCDLKPANVLRRTDGRVFLCDFGLSRHVTGPEDVPRGGTAGFLAPEQISIAFGEVTRQTDVYGLGGLFYALLTGRSPMAGRDLPDVLANVLSARAPEPPLQSDDALCAKINALVLRCLEKEPNRRFGNVREVSLAIEDLIGG